MINNYIEPQDPDVFRRIIMAQADRRAAASGEFIGKDVFKSSIQQAGNTYQAQFNSISYVCTKFNATLKIGEFKR